MTLHGAFFPRFAVSPHRQSWCYVGLLAGENNGRMKAVLAGGTAAAVSSRLYGVLTTELLWARFTAASGTDC